MSYRRKEVLLKSWSSGTGFAGIAGAGYSLACVWAKVSNFWSFIAVSPVVIVYGLVFYLVLVRSPSETAPGGLSASLLSGDDITKRSPQQEKVRLFDCSYFRDNSFLIFNCGTVYFLEYTIQTLFAHCALSGKQMTKWRFAFPLFNLCYQFGVFLSRSSLTFFAFPKVWILTLGQCGFFVLWLAQALWHFMTYLPIMCIAMVLVGLLGGCAYVNAFHLMMTDVRLSQIQREMVTSYNSFFISVCIFLSTVFTYAAENTFMIPDHPN
jgi:battenin